MNNKVIYTCLFGRYDILLQPEVVDPSYDYICFTDNDNLENDGVWQKIKINTTYSSNILNSRYAKILPHRVLSNYDISLYIDANIQIISHRIYEIISRFENSSDIVSQVEHPSRSCVYDENVVCSEHRLIQPCERVFNYIWYKLNGMPRKWGLFENNIILRKHNNELVKLVNEEWWKAFSRFARRDQLQLVVIYKKMNLHPNCIFGKGITARNTDCLRVINHSKKRNYFDYNWFDMLILRIVYRLNKYHILKI